MVFNRESRVVDDPRGDERRLFGQVPYVQPGYVDRESLFVVAWRSSLSVQRPRAQAPIARQVLSRDEARHHLHGREGRQQGRLRVVVLCRT